MSTRGLGTTFGLQRVQGGALVGGPGGEATIEAPFLGSGCSRVVQGAGRKAKRMVLQCNNGVGSNPVEGRTKI